MWKKILVISCICLAVMACSDDENDAKKQGVFDVYLQPINKSELKHQQEPQQTEPPQQQSEDAPSQ